MDYIKYYQGNETFITNANHRLKKIVNLIEKEKPKKILDVGCGNGTLLNLLTSNKNYDLHGVDVYEQKNTKWKYKLCDITDKIDYPAGYFDLVVLGEIIEHVPDPDHLLAEAHRVLKKDGCLIVTTPNMVSWLNRILVPLGIQPIFTETSTKMNLGRVTKKLGQGSKVQGHLKIFTFRSLREILSLNGFEPTLCSGVKFVTIFPFSIIDSVLSHYTPLSSDLVYVARKRK